MVEARIITFRQEQDVSQAGELVRVLRPIVVGPPVTGQLELEPIPRDEFSRDLAEQRAREAIAELVPKDEPVDISVDTVGA